MDILFLYQSKTPISHCRTRSFNPRLFHVRFDVDKVTLEQVLLFDLPPIVVITSLPHTRSPAYSWACDDPHYSGYFHVFSFEIGASFLTRHAADYTVINLEVTFHLIGEPGFKSRHGQEIFLFCTESIPVPGPTQPHIHEGKAARA
jgi:hypothetical protein